MADEDVTEETEVEDAAADETEVEEPTVDETEVEETTDEEATDEEATAAAETTDEEPTVDETEEEPTGDPLVVTVRTVDGGKGDTVNLDPTYFGVQPNIPLMHQVVTAQLAGIRRGTQSTKTRSEVRGGGAKPYRQKGTGRARQGSIRAPQHTGGGVALGPKPRSYKQRTPKKMVRAALRSALSDRALERKVMVVDTWGIGEPSTKQVRKALDALNLRGNVLIVLGREDVNVWKSFRNLLKVQPILNEELNCYDVLRNDWLVFTQGTLPGAGGEKENIGDTE